MKKPWIVDGEFKELNVAETEALDDEQYQAYGEALVKIRKERADEIEKKIEHLTSLEEKTSEQHAELLEMKSTLAGIDKTVIQGMLKAIKDQGVVLDELQKSKNNSGSDSSDVSSFKTAMKEAYDSNLEGIQKAIAQKNGYDFEVNKATQTYGDISPTDILQQQRSGIVDLVVRQPMFREMFNTIPLQTEYYKYMRQSTVVRDAQNVAVCTDVTSLTKEEIVVEDIAVKKVKDIIKFCLDFISDYPFMESRIRKLINDSIALKVDEQILLGTGTGNELNSISSYASEFSAANVACNVALSIQDATMVDLIKAMQVQIIELGQQNGYSPNVAIVNHCDWFKLVDSLKDANKNTLNNGVTMVGSTPTINGMVVVTSPIVAANTCYVIDTTKGEILDRQVLNLTVATENGTEWESEIASLKGFERLNLFVDPNMQNAFMKCTDVATAITAITAV